MRSWSFRVAATASLVTCACVGQSGMIGEIKKNYSDGVQVEVCGIVTASFSRSGCDPCTYIEDEDRAAGIKVYGFGGIEGIEYGLNGILRTDANGERCQDYVPVPIFGIASEVPKPLSLNGRCVGGGGSNGQPCTWGSCGVNNTGLLVRIHGRVTSIDYLNARFYICDGCCRRDGSGCKGIRVSYCDWPDGGPYMIPKPAKLGDPEGNGDYVVVTGICACVKIAGRVQPVIRLRWQTDIEWLYYGSGW